MPKSKKVFGNSEGFGSTVLVELSKEELLDIITALRTERDRQRLADRPDYAEDFQDRQRRLRKVLEYINESE